MKRLNPSLWPSAILFAGAIVNPIALAQDSDPEPGRLLNLSNRGLVGTGPERLIGSIITTGDTPVEVLVVARGPSLADLMPDDYTGALLHDPTVRLVEVPSESGSLQARNDDWRAWNGGEIAERFPGFIDHWRESGLGTKRICMEGECSSIPASN